MPNPRKSHCSRPRNQAYTIHPRSRLEARIKNPAPIPDISKQIRSTHTSRRTEAATPRENCISATGKLVYGQNAEETLHFQPGLEKVSLGMQSKPKQTHAPGSGVLSLWSLGFSKP